MASFNEFQFRAECMVDVLDFLNRMTTINPHIGINRIVIVQDELHGRPIPDCTISISTTAPLAMMVEVAARVIDGHVIVETMEHVADYTGIRPSANKPKPTDPVVGPMPVSKITRDDVLGAYNKGYMSLNEAAIELASSHGMSLIEAMAYLKSEGAPRDDVAK